MQALLPQTKADASKYYEPYYEISSLPINRNIEQKPVFAPTIEGAEKKLALADELFKWRWGAIKQSCTIAGTGNIDQKKAAKLLEGMGYADGKIELANMQLDERYKRLNEAAAVIGSLKKAYKEVEKQLEKATNEQDKAGLRKLMQDIAYAANAVASTILKMEEKYILWASRDWAEKDPQKIKDIFYQLVDANSYLAHQNLMAFYNFGYEENGERKYVTNYAHPSLERYYSYICMPKEWMDKQKKSGYKKMVENYIYNLGQFEKYFAKTVEKETSWFEYSEKIKNAQAWYEKVWAAASPFLEGASPVVAALSMLWPETAIVGYAYFGAEAIDNLKNKQYAEGALIAVTLALPIFRLMRGSGSAFLRASGKVGMQASLTAGTIFQLNIGLSTGRLLFDLGKYGLSVEQIQELETNLGFIAMPAAVNAASREIRLDAIPKKQEVKKEGIKNQEIKNADFSKMAEQLKELNEKMKKIKQQQPQQKLGKEMLGGTAYNERPYFAGRNVERQVRNNNKERPNWYEERNQKTKAVDKEIKKIKDVIKNISINKKIEFNKKVLDDHAEKHGGYGEWIEKKKEDVKIWKQNFDEYCKNRQFETEGERFAAFKDFYKQTAEQMFEKALKNDQNVHVIAYLFPKPIRYIDAYRVERISEERFPTLAIAEKVIIAGKEQFRVLILNLPQTHGNVEFVTLYYAADGEKTSKTGKTVKLTARERMEKTKGLEATIQAQKNGTYRISVKTKNLVNLAKWY